MAYHCSLNDAMSRSEICSVFNVCMALWFTCDLYQFKVAQGCYLPTFNIESTQAFFSMWQYFTEALIQRCPHFLIPSAPKEDDKHAKKVEREGQVSIEKLIQGNMEKMTQQWC